MSGALRRLVPDRLAQASASGSRELAERVVGATPRAKRILAERARVALGTLSPGTPVGQGRELAALLQRLETATLAECWLALAVMQAELPYERQVQQLYRHIRLDGTASLPAQFAAHVAAELANGSPASQVVVAQGVVTVDVQHTAHTDLATGIQRVVRETVRRWADVHDIRLVGWSQGFRAIRQLTGGEQATALFGAPSTPEPRRYVVVVPWQGVHLVPELAAQYHRSQRILAMARYSGCRVAAIGYDCVPLTTGETVVEGMESEFAGWLASARELDVIATISHAAGEEYRGWASMLAGLGVPGPKVVDVLLGAEVREPSQAAMDNMRRLLLVGRWPAVLVVGSHEPRKNHLSVLHAAERLWRDGLHFTLTFIGGNSWNSQAFQDRVNSLIAQGRAVNSFAAVPDDELWAAYRLATVTVFPSLNEGYGLPVAESLASGTPAITSNFGSMAEIAAGGGALVVDPRDDADVEAGLRRVLTEPETLQRLRDEARNRAPRGWDDYAAEVWSVLLGEARP